MKKEEKKNTVGSEYTQLDLDGLVSPERFFRSVPAGDVVFGGTEESSMVFYGGARDPMSLEKKDQSYMLQKEDGDFLYGGLTLRDRIQRDAAQQGIKFKISFSSATTIRPGEKETGSTLSDHMVTNVLDNVVNRFDVEYSNFRPAWMTKLESMFFSLIGVNTMNDDDDEYILFGTSSGKIALHSNRSARNSSIFWAGVKTSKLLISFARGSLEISEMDGLFHIRVNLPTGTSSKPISLATLSEPFVADICNAISTLTMAGFMFLDYMLMLVSPSKKWSVDTFKRLAYEISLNYSKKDVGDVSGVKSFLFSYPCPCGSLTQVFICDCHEPTIGEKHD